MMLSLFRALSAELFKTRRTLALVLACLTPLSMALLELAICLDAGLNGDAGVKMYRPGADPWMMLIGHTTMIWALLLLPLFITLEMGLLGALEHGNKTWKQLYTLPLPRWSLYAAKQILGMGIVGLSMVVLGLMIIGVGLFARLFLPALGFAAPLPWADLVRNLFLSYLAAWLMISIHLWISLRWSSFVLAMAAGVVPTVCGVVIINSKWVVYDPWTMPAVVSRGLAQAEPYALSLAIGLIGGIVVACLGCLEMTRHDVRA